MRAHRILLSFAISVCCGVAYETPAFSQEYQGTMEQQMACTPDVFRLCGAQIPDANRIVACLRQNTPHLSRRCREVFTSSASSNAGALQPSPPLQAVPRRRDLQ